MLMTHNQWELATTGYEECGMLLNVWYKLLAWDKGITLYGDRAERQQWWIIFGEFACRWHTLAHLC